MKILHIVLSLGKGGAEKLLVDFLPLYVSKGHEISVLQLSSILESKEYIDLVKKEGIKFYSLSTGALKNPLLIFKIRKFLKSNNFDIIHVHLFPSLYFTALATICFSNRPVLVFTEHSSKNGRNTKFYFRPIERFMYSKYDAIIAISDKIKEHLILWTGLKSKIHTIFNGVNLNHFDSVNPYTKDAWSESFDIPFDSFKVLMVARFSHPKDHLTVVKAMEQLPKNIHLLFVGDGDNLKSLKDYSKKKVLVENIHFLGFRQDIPLLMKSVDIVVLSSLYEGMSGVTLEALASKTVFLGSDVSGINEVVPDERFLFESQNSEMLANKIKMFVNNPELMLSMQNDGYNFVRKFDVSKMVEDHLLLYGNLLHKKVNDGK